jgi:hypothetical protein
MFCTEAALGVEVEERGGLVLGNNIVDGLVVDGSEGGIAFVVVVNRRRREIGRSAFPHGTVKGGAKASVSHIALGPIIRMAIAGSNC